ncbi:uncharacterized protein CDAR_200711 [Caerostris darwini]|uniref:F-box domain-containing protein n=1 Tax=Caerostris darwini TaxID=1538125 RepID=A0AAV4TZZ5_9ARAC|nr:uncharacterized protein CDAR_200711 [Caerostris darwini]
MTAEVSFTKRAAAELSRRFNGLTVRSRGSSASATPPSNPSTPQPQSKGVGQLASWMVEGVKKQQPKGNRLVELCAGRPHTAEALWLDPAFLAQLFWYFSGLERAGLTQVCRRWRDVLYDKKAFWRGIMPVLHCRELRATSGDLSSTSELRKNGRLTFHCFRIGCNRHYAVHNVLVQNYSSLLWDKGSRSFPTLELQHGREADLYNM